MKKRKRNKNKNAIQIVHCDCNLNEYNILVWVDLLPLFQYHFYDIHNSSLF